MQQELQRKEDKGPASRGMPEGWRAKHREFFQNKDIAWTALQVPDEVKESPWFKFLTERERDIVAWGIMFAEQKQAAAKLSAASQDKRSAASQDSKYLAVDVSQRLDRCRVSCDGTLFTVLPSQKVYLLGQDGCGKAKVGAGRLLLGAESLALQGYLHGACQCSDSQKQDLAGNAFTSTVLLALLLALYANLPDYSWSEDEGKPCLPARKRKVTVLPEDIASVCAKLNFESEPSDSEG